MPNVRPPTLKWLKFGIQYLTSERGIIVRYGNGIPNISVCNSIYC
jgi:hypothetical protein